MSEWREYKIGEICTINKEQYSAKENWNSFLYLDTGNITKGVVDELQFFSSFNDLPSRARRKVKSGDIVYSTVRPNQEHYGYISNPPSNLLVSTGFAVITVNREIIEPLFLFNFLTKPQVTKYLQAIGEQSVCTYPAINTKDIEDLLISVPPIDEQRRIASILSSLDDKIANNRRICENLEAQAQALFKHWFIDFAPFKNGNFIESELGMIPEGWRVGTLGDVCIQITDGVHNTVTDDTTSAFYLLSAKNIKKGIINISDNERRINEDVFKSLRKRTKLSKKDVLLTSVGTLGELCYLNYEPNNIEFQRSVAILKANETYAHGLWLYHLLKSNINKVIHMGHGAVQQCIFIGDLKKFMITIPTKNIIDSFIMNVSVKYDLITSLQKESSRLATLRDTLLPKLMSGQIKL